MKHKQLTVKELQKKLSQEKFDVKHAKVFVLMPDDSLLPVTGIVPSGDDVFVIVGGAEDDK